MQQKLIQPVSKVRIHYLSSVNGVIGDKSSDSPINPFTRNLHAIFFVNCLYIQYLCIYYFDKLYACMYNI